MGRSAGHGAEELSDSNSIHTVAKDSERNMRMGVQVTKQGCTALIGLAKLTLGWFLLVLGLAPLCMYELAVSCSSDSELVIFVCPPCQHWDHRCAHI